MVLVVLILVWVEYGLGALLRELHIDKLGVLILVWVEYGLGVINKYIKVMKKDSLNPCLGGIWSWSMTQEEAIAAYIAES